MSGRDIRRMDIDRNYRPDIRSVSSAAGHFGGTMVDESKDRQPYQQLPDRGVSAEFGARNHSRNNPVIPVPYEQHTGPLRPNNIHFICGIPHQNARRMTINLQCGKDIVAFHFDVRFNYIGYRNMIVRTTKQRNGWEQEERSLPGGPFPFQPNKYFEVIILSEPHCFKVAVNNKHLLEFKHRVPLERVDTLHISGDVTLKQVRFQE